jgi:hypothetical protein
MMTLTNDWSGLNARIDAMQPVGNTNVTIGLQVAFQSLSAVAPFNAAAPQSDLDKVIILLTDGDNTQNRFSTSTNSIDSRTEKACTNANAANIKVYTVRVIDGNANLLRGCATKPGCSTMSTKPPSSTAYSPRSPRTSPTCASRNSAPWQLAPHDRRPSNGGART